MSLSAATVWEVRTTGSDSNGGGFVAGASGTDYSQQNAAQYSFADLASTNGNTASPAVTSASHSFAAADVGNILRVTAGTSWTAGFYQIVSVAGGAATLDRACGSVASLSAGSYVVGGAFASPGQAGAAKVAGNDIYVRAGTYSITSATANVAGGCVTDSTGGTGQTDASRWIGYNTTRTPTNTDSKPLLQASGAISSFTILNATANHTEFYNLSVDCASKTTSTGISLGTAYTRAVRCKVANTTVKGLNLADNSNSVKAVLCEATGCSGTAGIYIGASGPSAILCESHGNTCHGFQLANSASATLCLSYSNTGASTDGFNGSSVGYQAVSSTAFGNGRAGFDLTGNAGFGAALVNCLSYGNTTEGFATDAVKAGAFLFNCAGGSNTSGNYNASNLVNVFNFQALTGNPFTNSAGGDFSLNNTASAGAACRAAGIPGVYPAGTTTGYLDIGAAQHQDTGGGGVTAPFIIGG